MSISNPNDCLREHLENCKIPLTRDGWTEFVKELDNLKVRELFFTDWINRERKRFDRLIKSRLFEDRVKDAFIIALHQISILRNRINFLVHKQDELFNNPYFCIAWLERTKLETEKLELKQPRDLKKNRDRKPDAPSPTKNWLEPMPIFNEGQPCGYVQATGQRRKVIEGFLRSIKAKTERPLPQKQRGRPISLYGFEINCRVLDQWLGNWCSQNPEVKYDRILTEALLLATEVADAKSPVNGKRLARLRRIFRIHTRPITEQTDEDFNFDFLGSPAACALQIKRLREKFPPPAPPATPSPEGCWLTEINKVFGR